MKEKEKVGVSPTDLCRALRDELNRLEPGSPVYEAANAAFLKVWNKLGEAERAELKP